MTSEIKPGASHYRVNVCLQEKGLELKTAAMVDSGATALFLDERFVRKHKIPTFLMKKALPIYNVDGTENRAGKIERCASLRLTVDQMSAWMDFLVTDLGGENVILGLPWLREANPSIDWEKGLLQVRGRSDRVYDDDDFWATEEDVKAGATTGGEEDGSLLTPVKIKANRKQRREWRREGVIEELEDEVWCAAGVTYSQQIAEEAA